MDQAIEVVRLDADPGRVRVAQDEIHIVDRVQSGKEKPQHPQPRRTAKVVFLRARPNDEKRDVVGIEPLPFFKDAARRTTDSGNNVGELRTNDLRSERLVRQLVARGRLVARQKSVVEKMPERPVPDVVQKPGDAKKLFDAAARGNRAARFRGRPVEEGRILFKNAIEALVPRVPDAACETHRPERVREPGMFRRRVDEPRRLKLMDLTQPLEPRRIDQISLVSGLARRRIVRRRRDRDVSVNRIVNERFRLITFLDKIV